MAAPKRRMSRISTRARRSQWKSNDVASQEVKVNGRVYNVPRRIAKAVQFGLVDVEKFQRASFRMLTMFLAEPQSASNAQNAFSV